MEEGAERFAALVLLLTCLSHIAVPQVWAELFERVRRQGEMAGLIIAAIHLPLGLIVVAFHPVWTWPGVVITLIGWALLLKGGLHLLFPALAKRSIALGSDGTATGRYRLGGLVMLPLAIWVGWIALN